MCVFEGGCFVIWLLRRALVMKWGDGANLAAALNPFITLRWVGICRYRHLCLCRTKAAIQQRRRMAGMPINK